MNIKKKLGKEELIIEPKQQVGAVKHKLRVHEEDTVELLRLIPIVYDVLDSVIERKYPYEEVTLDGRFLGLQVALEYNELKRRSYKVGFKNKVKQLVELLPSIMEGLYAKGKDYYILNGLRCTENAKRLFIGSDYGDNTILITYVNDNLYAIVLDKVEIPFKYEKGIKEVEVEIEDETEDEHLDESYIEVNEEKKRQQDIFNKLVATTKDVMEESLPMEDNDPKKEVEDEKEGSKLTSKDVSLDNLSEEEKKKLEDEVLDMLNSL